MLLLLRLLKARSLHSASSRDDPASGPLNPNTFSFLVTKLNLHDLKNGSALLASLA